MFSGIFFDDQPGLFETIPTPLAGASKEVGDLGHPIPFPSIHSVENKW
jgi:hypothetical protein